MLETENNFWAFGPYFLSRYKGVGVGWAPLDRPLLTLNKMDAFRV